MRAQGKIRLHVTFSVFDKKKCDKHHGKRQGFPNQIETQQLSSSVFATTFLLL